jgi:membrane fusion protein (multidrug efflux system)
MPNHRRQDRAPVGALAQLFRRFAAPPVALAIVGAFSLACDGEGAADPDSEGPRTVTVEIVTVEPKPLRDSTTFSGQLDAEFSVVVKAEIDGVVAEILFEEGQRVAAGEVLIRLRNGVQKAVVREAVANQALAQQEFDRTARLVKKNAVSKAESDRGAAELEVSKARAARAKVELGRTELRAPFDGVAGFRMVSPGDFINDETPVVRIDSTERLKLTFEMSELGLRVARVGALVEARVSAYPGETFPGKVYVVSPTLDPATRRVVLKAWIPNADGRLLPGMFAETDFELGRREAAITVPESAVVFDRHGAFVWRVGAEDIAERVPIQSGLRKGGIVEVTMGLEAGDTIVSAGTNKVGEGDKIVAAPSVQTGQASRAAEPGPGGGEGT